MSFEKQNLSVLAYANGFTLWYYKTEDEGEKVLKKGYFQDARNIINDNDRIIVHSKDENFDYNINESVFFDKKKVMKVKEAIEQGKDFTYTGVKYFIKNNGNVYYIGGKLVPIAILLDIQDKDCEVE